METATGSCILASHIFEVVDSLKTWVSAIHMGNLDGLSGSWLPSGPVLAGVAFGD